jgi:hypothetical protein
MSQGEGVFDSSVNTNEGVRTHLEFYLQVDIVFFFFAKGSQQYLNGHTSFLLLIEALLDDRHHRGHGFCSICSRKRGHQSHHEGVCTPSHTLVGLLLTTTLRKIFPAHCVRNCLSIMFSCGMYDYSGGALLWLLGSIRGRRLDCFCSTRSLACANYCPAEFAYAVGLPAKSGVSGCVMVVVPNLLVTTPSRALVLSGLCSGEE